MELHIVGSVNSPLTHMTLYGLAGILDDAAIPDVRIYFTDEPTPRACVTADVASSETIAQAVFEHARAHAKDSWVTATMTHEGRPGTGVMSPRIKLPSSPGNWAALQARRWIELDAVLERAAMLDVRMIGGLGEPAYWRCTEGNSQPDQGASRWEMKTRNRGEEFVGNRLGPLAIAVAKRTSKSIESGLAGTSVADYTADPDSRTATGFAPPGQVDASGAWCALWGIANFPVVHSGVDRSATPGAQKRNRLSPNVMVLPVFTRPTSSGRVRMVLRSAQGDVVAGLLATTSPGFIVNEWLVDHGVRGVARFDVVVVGSVSAPERRVLDGTVIPVVSS